MPQTKTEWGQDWPDMPAPKEFGSVGPASGDAHLNDDGDQAEIRAANNAFGASAAGNSPSDPGWDIGPD